jgi:hypothetical protein
MNPPRKYRLCLFYVVVFNYCCNVTSYSQANCERTDFHDNNNLNDTTKVIFKNRVVFDTTANRLSGRIMDNVAGIPIPKAWVLITKDSQKFIDSTNDKGEFTFFKDGFSGKWQMLIRDRAHRCLQINDINIGGGLDMIIKLSPYFRGKN